jgi:alpha-beta hydrolase superfamily lysophospholipase
MVRWQNPLSAEWQPVAVASKSGATVRGLFAHSQAEAGPAKATIVLGHPMGKEAKGYFLKNGYTDLLRRGGYHVLVFDLNGFGESSQGNFSYFEDIIAIGNAALALTPELPSRWAARGPLSRSPISTTPTILLSLKARVPP